MMRNRRTGRVLIFLSALVLAVMGAVFLFSRTMIRPALDQNAVVEGFSVSSEDAKLLIRWDYINAPNLQGVQITVTDDTGAVRLSERCLPDATSVSFSDGKHGVAYTVSAKLILSDGTETGSVSERRLFLDYGQLPELPFIKIDTETGEKPYCEHLEHPEYLAGVATVNNAYLYAHMTLAEKDGTKSSHTVQIRVRGNTSSYMPKTPYKIKLDAAADLLGSRSSQYAHTDWYLIYANDLNLMVGMETALLCGMEWQPRYRLVNLMLNGDYMGTYWLTEAVGTGKSRCDIASDGYLMELDAYWWNSGENYFKLEDTAYIMGFTFKYPDEDRLNSQKISVIRDYWAEAVQYLYQGDPTYAEYLDIESFSAWLLTHDILGTYDGAGSNQYFYKHSMSEDSTESAKLKMGPAWDFDSIYRNTDSWSAVRTAYYAYFKILTEQPNFQQAYINRWETLSETLAPHMARRVADFVQENETAIRESLYLDSVRWQNTPRDLDAEVAAINAWFTSRTAWINEQLNSQ